ncbi:MAG: carboxypeptidase-like regulatory domain-containing protein, partial [Verrucomicrobiota bacterium]|nr:carboxypeptidase-like regulatory domain-containing protein [Verrucomicrobiota bacterium]
MKTLIRGVGIALLFLGVSLAYGAVPALNVTVSDASGKAAYKGMTNAKGMFATTSLKPGNYVVQLNSKSVATKGAHYAIVVSAGMKKVTADAVPGEKFAGGGVALKVEVGPGLN